MKVNFPSSLEMIWKFVTYKHSILAREEGREGGMEGGRKEGGGVTFTSRCEPREQLKSQQEDS